MIKAEERIELGDRAKDKITKQTGIVIAITDWLYGCRRLTIQPEEVPKDNDKIHNFTLDEPQAELVKRRVITGRHLALETDARRHGNRPDAGARAPDPTR